jgi:DNA (cytosine-5)-methyltransferase 3A
MSCGQIALERAGIPVKQYFASEVDKWAIKVTQHNYPNTIQIGDVTKVRYENSILSCENGEFVVGGIDLVIGGSPCQSISNLGDGSGLAGKSGLFYHWLRLKNEICPNYWLLENVKGSKKAINEISELLGKSPVLLNSADFSAQQRNRLYWSNLPIEEPLLKSPDRLIDILDNEIKDTSLLSKGRLAWLLSEKGKQCVAKRYANIDLEKAACLTARSDASWNCNYVTREGMLTKLSCEEYEKLQTVPEGYTNMVKSSERYKMLGNGWTVDVIAHIFKGMLPK